MEHNETYIYLGMKDLIKKLETINNRNVEVFVYSHIIGIKVYEELRQLNYKVKMKLAPPLGNNKINKLMILEVTLKGSST